MATPEWAGELPAPYEALLELGMTPDDIEDSYNRRPLITAMQADQREGAYFSVEHARRALSAVESFRHTKGRWGNTPLKLQNWQKVWIVYPLFGWVFHDEEIDRTIRVIRSAWVEVPRKAGKSTLSSGIALTLLLADREIGAEVYAAAGSLEQAGRVAEDAKRMAMTSKAVRGRVEVLRNVIRVPRTGGVFRPLSKIAETAHGLNVSGGVIDEVHTFRSRDLVDAIETGTGARDQPLIVFITTADEGGEGSIYDEKRTFVERCADGTVNDPAQYGVVWAAPDGADPFDPETWQRANPGLGVSPSLSYIRREAEKAKASPSYFPTFMRLSLNRRMRSSSRWITQDMWAAGDGPVDSKRLRGRKAWGGVDLSAVSDLSAWVIAAESRRPGVELELISRFWLPEERVDELEKQLRVPLRQWARDGYLTLTEGDAVDYETIQKQVLDDCRRLDIQRVSYDRMFAGQMVQHIDQKTRGVQVVPVAQTYLGMSPGCKELERLLREKRIAHGDNPILTWMAMSVEVYADGNDNIRPVKPDRHKSSARIDGIAAAVMALDGYVRRPIRRKRAASA
ncbi:terminase large subunit [Streptomyces sp. NBC_00841]|uniref:terminase large subunit n=1 Tax=Streptomyces sp. NBC_00841 TaxID=2975847 RepID=UPI002DD88FA2|nr:terminase TerL endonuclease subunit [Streptomyces sp. NBC_00841]WRZ98079.1 terminase large subunit [Streptomyces sp. NBC_00841]